MTRRATALASTFAALAASLLAIVGAASAAHAAVVMNAPDRVVQGNDANVYVAATPAGVRCTLVVKYRNGAKQKGLGAKQTSGGAASWHWKVPRTASPGLAHATVSCKGAGKATKTFMIIGQVIPAHISVEKTGFSVRTLPYGGSIVSWGVILKNDSPSDAEDVTVLANLVMPDNKLIGSMTVHSAGIPAGREYGTGGDLNFMWVPPIARVEIVVTVNKSGSPTRHFPAPQNIRVVPQPFDPVWVGSVEGEIQNDQASLWLQSAELSAVILDGSGNILGGGTGLAYATLPPGARLFFKIQSGMQGIAVANAAQALVYVNPSYKTS